MSVGTFRKMKDRERRVAGLGRNVAIRTDSHLRASLDVQNGKTANADEVELGHPSSGLCLS